MSILLWKWMWYGPDIDFCHGSMGAQLTHSPVKQVKIIKWSFKASGNGPKRKQQMKKYLLKKIYQNSVKKLRVCVIWTKTIPFLPFLQPGEVETPLGTAVANNMGFPLSPAPTHRLSVLFSQPPAPDAEAKSWLTTVERRTVLSSTQHPLVKQRLCLKHGTLRILGPRQVLLQLTR